MGELRRLSRRGFLRAAGIAGGAAVLAACVPATPTPVPAAATATPAEAVPSPAALAPVVLTYWDWHQPRVNVYEPYFARYCEEIVPGSRIEVTIIPWAEYWTKAMAAIPAGQGPDIYHFHNSQHSAFIGAGLVERWPMDMPDLFDLADFRENWAGFKEGHFTYIPDGNIYYIPYGSMAPVLYVNEEYWQEAGLTDADAPKTWDEVPAVAKKLSKYAEDGELIQAGFGFNGYANLIWSDMLYQQGQWWYDKSGKKVQFDTPASRNALRILRDFIDLHKVNSSSFLSFTEGFGTRKIAMTWSWTWFSGFIRTNYPDLKFISFPQPTFTGTDLPAYGRQNYEVSIVVNPKPPKDQKLACWQLLKWLYSNDELLVDLNLAHNIVPAKRTLREHPRIQADREIKILAEHVDYTVFPGEFPHLLWEAFGRYIDQDFIQGNATLDETISMLVTEGNRILAERDYWIIERNYPYADRFTPHGE